MSEAATARVQQAEAPKANRTGAVGLQRQCACGQHTFAGEECHECQKRRMALDASPVNRPAPASLERSVGPAAAVNPFSNARLGHDFSRVRARTDVLPARESRESQDDRDSDAATVDASQADTKDEVAGAENASPALLAEDDAADLQPGQMRKSEFLAQLHLAVRATVEAGLRGTGRSTDGCPYLEFWFGYYEHKSSARVERAIHRYAPEADRAATASEYTALISERVGRSVDRWARTGELTGLPEGIPLRMPGGAGMLGAIGRLASGTSGLFFKERKGGARNAEDPLAIQAQLGEGRPLDSGVRSRMEHAFGQSFSQVRAHTDAEAATLSSRLNARAFTIGEHLSFGRGEYRPGTLVGDALIAHELAHVVQQSGHASSVAPMEMRGAGYKVLEEDADAAAVGVVASLWGGTSSALANMASGASPRLRSGLRLSRCGATCPTDIQLAQLHPVPLTEDHVRRGWRTGWGAVAEMTVSDAKGSNFNGASIHENLNPGANTCTGVENCENTHGMGGAGGATFEVGSGLGPSEKFSCGPPFLVPSLIFPAKKNTFYDCHLAGFGSSKLHALGLQTCRQDCQQYYDCNGSRIGSNNFTITRDFSQDVINGVDVTRIGLAKA